MPSSSSDSTEGGDVALQSLNAFFNPRSVAVIGATETLGFGHVPTKNILSHQGVKTYLVNVKGGRVMGVDVFRSVRELPEAVDLAVIMVPSGSVLEVVKECAERGIRHAIIESAGFSETGEAGARLEREVVAVARANNMRVIGPNCVGVVNTSNMFTTADVDVATLVKGGVALIAQSGVFGTALVDRACSEGLGLSKVVTLGNKCDVDEVDVVEYLADDEETKVIGLYVEGVKPGRGRRMVEVFRVASARKPILVLKSGRTEAGSRAVRSHTGSLAGSDRIFDAAVRQSGAIRVESIDELFYTAMVLASQPLPHDGDVAILTNSGSLGAMMCDELESLGVKLAALLPETVDGLKKVAPPWASCRNPVDVGPAIIESALPAVELLGRDPNVGSMIMIFGIPGIVSSPRYFGADLTPFFEILGEAASKAGKPTVVLGFGDERIIKMAEKGFGKSHIPVLRNLTLTARAIATLYKYKKIKEKNLTSKSPGE
ncbi:MAG: CoA-binding protein [Candidatus Freyarchaeota archaeon]|nr:CoA-binding protein [Candidatus Jordarchaeia archaeon]